ncbi:hypothetical protein K438DRAFT_1755307 [Mycena galopus ATCC 62051]|nr:hypothetical protein K438DRAFT_1755307 [Mycena galopus ATCC 62051]
MSDSDGSQNEAQFGMTGGFQFVAYTLDVALWGAAMVRISTLQANAKFRFMILVMHSHSFFNISTDMPRKILWGFVLLLIATNHILFYAVQNYKDLILLFGNYEAQNIIILQQLLTAISLPHVHSNEDNVLCQSNLDVPRWIFVAPVIFLATLQFAAGIGREPVTGGESLPRLLEHGAEKTIRMDSVLEKMSIYAINRGAMTRHSMGASSANLQQFLAMPGSFVFMLFILPSCQLYVISVCGMLMSRESLLEELRAQNGIITTLDVTSADNEETRRNISRNSDNGAVHVTTSIVRWIDQIPDGGESRTEGNVETKTSSSTISEV